MYACHVYITPQFLFVSDPRRQITGAAFKFMKDGCRPLHIPEALGENSFYSFLIPSGRLQAPRLNLWKMGAGRFIFLKRWVKNAGFYWRRNLKSYRLLLRSEYCY
jgi:hypothetical protein